MILPLLVFTICIFTPILSHIIGAAQMILSHMILLHGGAHGAVSDLGVERAGADVAAQALPVLLQEADGPEAGGSPTRR